VAPIPYGRRSDASAGSPWRRGTRPRDNRDRDQADAGEHRRKRQRRRVEHPATGERPEQQRRGETAADERVVAVPFPLFVAALFAQFRAEPAEQQREHEPDREQVVVRQQSRVHPRECRQQHRSEGDQPHLVGVPHRAERRQERLPLVLGVPSRVQQADSEVEPVEDEVHPQREHDDAEPDLR